MQQNALPCWEITKCEGTDDCPARMAGDKPCWEIARSLDDYRNALNVCGDCIVYISKHADSVLSAEEINNILEQKGVCVLLSQCSQHSPGAVSDA
ncbi:MAG: hypothetical protein OEL66_09820 [Desulfobulbaceae bacterium]|nr:hypothetical protein [Desulfobulbaceae bacterium]